MTSAPLSSPRTTRRKNKLGAFFSSRKSEMVATPMGVTKGSALPIPGTPTTNNQPPLCRPSNLDGVTFGNFGGSRVGSIIGRCWTFRLLSNPPPPPGKHREQDVVAYIGVLFVLVSLGSLLLSWHVWESSTLELMLRIVGWQTLYAYVVMAFFEPILQYLIERAYSAANSPLMNSTLSFFVSPFVACGNIPGAYDGLDRNHLSRSLLLLFYR